MPSPKSGKAGNAVAPTEPGDALEADDADPGKTAETKTQQQAAGEGKYGASAAKPHKKDPTKTSWIEIVLIDEADQPVPGEAYRITLPDGETVAEGTLDGRGFARVDGIDPGTCQITFPRLDAEAWEPA